MADVSSLSLSFNIGVGKKFDGLLSGVFVNFPKVMLTRLILRLFLVFSLNVLMSRGIMSCSDDVGRFKLVEIVVGEILSS